MPDIISCASIIVKYTPNISVSSVWLLDICKDNKNILCILISFFTVCWHAHIPIVIMCNIQVLHIYLFKSNFVACWQVLTCFSISNFSSGYIGSLKYFYVIFVLACCTWSLASTKIVSPSDITYFSFVVVNIMLIYSVQKLDFLSERIISLAFDVVSRVLETGPVSSLRMFLWSKIIKWTSSWENITNFTLLFSIQHFCFPICLKFSISSGNRVGD